MNTKLLIKAMMLSLFIILFYASFGYMESVAVYFFNTDIILVNILAFSFAYFLLFYTGTITIIIIFFLHFLFYKLH